MSQPDDRPHTLENPPPEHTPKKKPKSLSGWLNRAKRGDTGARYELGRCYEEGIGTGRNMAEAIRWYQKAADAGSADAQYALGRCYAAGKGLRQWHKEAVHWFTLAAEKNHPEALCALGLCYAFGRGVANDDEKAKSCLRQAAQSFPAAAEILSTLFTDRKVSPGTGRYLVRLAQDRNLPFVYDRIQGGYFWIVTADESAMESFLKACGPVTTEFVFASGGSADTAYEPAFRTAVPVVPD